MKAKAFVMIPHSDKKATAIEWEILPLVRCKDCKLWYEDWKHDNNECYCYRNDRWTEPDAYCSGGEQTESE